jgi:N-acetylglucosaminyl-diphospho-decaprenol L-rhamnosyltransferase
MIRIRLRSEHLASHDDWPHTRRVLPWLVAGLVAMIYLIPFDSITLPVHLPVDSDFDRFALGGTFLVWLAVRAAGASRPRLRGSPMDSALLVFVLICVLSIGINLPSLAWDGELSLSLKELSLVASYVALFYVCASSIRASEVPAYIRLLVLLAALSALGTIFQYRTGSNPFFSIAADIFGGTHVESPIVAAAAANPVAAGAAARPLITGPAQHGLADATILAAAIPFGLLIASSAKRSRDKFFWLFAVGLLIAGCVATGRKTALLVPLVSVLVLGSFGPRRYLRPLVPLLLISIVGLEVLAPHAISRIVFQLSHATSSSSTTTRTLDYPAVVPFVLSHLLIGRGYGSFDPLKYRILDDQMLGWLVEIGFLGLVSYVGIFVAAAVTSLRGAKLSANESKGTFHCVIAVTAGFFLSNFFYDTFGFRQAPYIFFFVVALGVALRSTESRDNERLLDPAPRSVSKQSPLITLDVSAAADPMRARPGPKLSVLMVTYRNPDMTRECLESLMQAVDGLDAEVLVWDNASPDDTPHVIAREFAGKIAFFPSPTNLGFAAANNALAKRASGEYLLLLNPDTIISKTAIQALLDLAGDYPRAGICGGRTVDASGKLDPRSCWNAPTLWSLTCFGLGLSTVFPRSSFFNPEAIPAFRRDYVREVDIVTGCLALLSADLWRTLGGFDEAFWMYGEDADLSLRIRKLGYRPMISPQASITHFVGASSMPGRKIILLLGARVSLIRKHWPGVSATVGIQMLKLGCGLRSLAGSQDNAWRHAWLHRQAWLDGRSSLGVSPDLLTASDAEAPPS